MPKSEWFCEWCGEKFNSRSSRLYHKKNTCSMKPPDLTDVPDDNNDTVPDTEVKTDVIIPVSEKKQPVKIKENKKKYEKEMGVTIPGDEEEEIIPDTSDDDFPVLAVFVLAIAVGLVTFIVVFRDALFGLFRKPPQRPTPTPAVM